MKRVWIGAASLLLAATGAGFSASPAAAQTQQAVLYEMVEDMYLKNSAGDPVFALGQAASRMADAALLGWAKLGTPLCPSSVLVTKPTLQTCTVTVRGLDSITLSTGKGTVQGTYAVVIQGDNATDAPEFVVQTGTFRGDMDFSLSMTGTAPLGYITNGVMIVDGSNAAYPFTGTFRLPFTTDTLGKKLKARRGTASFYLDDARKPIPVMLDEMALGVPTVRLELIFP